MTLTDPISEMITIIRNGLSADKQEVVVWESNLKSEILKILKKEKFIEDFKKDKKDNKNILVIKLRYIGDAPAINEIKRMSKPGRRLYIDKNHIPNIKSGRGKVIISTSKGLLTSAEAKKEGIGGELIVEVW